jgi:hypothetical protein
MTDTFTRVSDSLLSAIGSKDNKVTVLRGNWGTGKTYLWEYTEKKLISTNPKPIYISIFGAKSINDLKLRILQAAYLKDKIRTEKLVANVGNAISGVLQRFFGFNATEAALLWVPELVSKRLVVIDDVERKHKSLEIDEVLGLIDEYSQGHETQFLLLLNSDKLADSKALWEVMHEKVIDAEIVLNPSALEAFDAVATGIDLKYLPVIRNAISVLKINNIRVIKRILSTIQKLSTLCSLDDAPPQRWVPSTVLLTAMQYRAIDNPPTIEFIRDFNSVSRSLTGSSQQEGDKDLDWSRMLNNLGIAFSDDYEILVHDYLQSGEIDTRRLDNVVAQYRRDALNQTARAQYDNFFEALFWDTTASKDDLLAQARGLLPTVNVISPPEVSNIALSIEESLGAKDLADEFIDAWIASIETRPEFQNVDERDFRIPRSVWHPRIIECLTQLRNKQHPPLSLTEAIFRIVETSSWGQREWTAFERSTAAEYELVLARLSGDPLRRFVAKHFDWIRDGAPDAFTAEATENFIEACRRICQHHHKSRLAFVLKGTFTAERREELLT